MLIGSLSEDVHLQRVKRKSNFTLQLCVACFPPPHLSPAILSAVCVCVGGVVCLPHTEYQNVTNSASNEDIFGN